MLDNCNKHFLVRSRKKVFNGSSITLNRSNRENKSMTVLELGSDFNVIVECCL